MTAREPSDGDGGTGATEHQAGVGSRSDALGRTGDRHCVAAWAGFGTGDSAHTDERNEAGSKAEKHPGHQDRDSQLCPRQDGNRLLSDTNIRGPGNIARRTGRGYGTLAA
jgi:hypothetical protein